MTKLGLHVNKVTNLLVPFVRDTKPRLIKFLDHDLGTIKACHDVSPNSILIGRLFVTRVASNRNQVRRSVSSMKFSSRLVVAESLF